MSKYSNRIQTIQSLVPKSCKNIWDLCCDHGQIGEVFLNNHNVFFVDQVPSIIEKLRNKLTADIPTTHIILSSVLNLKINTKNNCFILAGIGSDLAIKMITHLTKQDPEGEFVISTHKNVLKLREFLHHNSFHAFEEILITEHGQFYQVFRCKKDDQLKPIELLPEAIFLNSNKLVSSDFLKEQIQLYQKKAEFNQELQYILDHYSRCMQKFSIKF